MLYVISGFRFGKGRGSFESRGKKCTCTWRVLHSRLHLIQTSLRVFLQPRPRSFDSDSLLNSAMHANFSSSMHTSYQQLRAPTKRGWSAAGVSAKNPTSSCSLIAPQTLTPALVQGVLCSSYNVGPVAAQEAIPPPPWLVPGVRACSAAWPSSPTPSAFVILFEASRGAGLRKSRDAWVLDLRNRRAPSSSPCHKHFEANERTCTFAAYRANLLTSKCFFLSKPCPRTSDNWGGHEDRRFSSNKGQIEKIFRRAFASPEIFRYAVATVGRIHKTGQPKN